MPCNSWSVTDWRHDSDTSCCPGLQIWLERPGAVLPVLRLIFPQLFRAANLLGHLALGS
jgi:hypothetical protein